jgi:hypothetical protein
LRSLGASQVEKSTVNASEFGSTHKRGTEAGSQVSAVSEVSVPSSVMMETAVASAPIVAEVAAPIPSIVPEMASVSQVVTAESTPVICTNGEHSRLPSQSTTSPSCLNSMRRLCINVSHLLVLITSAYATSIIILK